MAKMRANPSCRDHVMDRRQVGFEACMPQKLTQFDAGRRSLTQIGALKIKGARGGVLGLVDGVATGSVSMTNALTILRSKQNMVGGNK